MEDVETQNCSFVALENDEAQKSESAENFQKFIYELFENNGVINDLRAYLRGHIVEVLRCAQTGEPTSCQKHFTQRLELPFQALNILLLEYLLRMEFSYSLSVFITEVPLANMVFAYARTIMQAVEKDPALKFVNEDIWSILNYLGIKCDSDHAMNIMQMYNRDKNPPLLLCILQCMPMYKEYKTAVDIPLVSTRESVISNVGNVTPQYSKTDQHCKHYAKCKACHEMVDRIKDRFRRKKNDLVETMKEFSNSTQNMDNLLKNIDYMEKHIIDEMFEQVKSVYEAEVEMLKSDEDLRVQRYLESASAQLQRKKEELEEQFKVRSEHLERNVEKKKRFLWGLARSLRDQHDNISNVMTRLREDTRRLETKEENVKAQMAEAENALRQRAEEMRKQIMNELQNLEEHLEAMKKERVAIDKERKELEQIKKAQQIKNDENSISYDLLKNEFASLKGYLETANIGKCFVEKGTVTELIGVNSNVGWLNNGQDLNRNGDRVKPTQLVNDLKKQKNVNFVQIQGRCEEHFAPSSRSRSSASSEAGDASAPRDVTGDVTLLRDYHTLRQYVEQQREQIEELTAAQARLQAQLLARPLTRPQTAPAQLNSFQTVNTTANNVSHGWRKGAGEELSFLANTEPRIVVPGDNIPFIGAVRDRHDYRRSIINQWRTLRRRMSPIAVSRRLPPPLFIERQVARNSSPGLRSDQIFRFNTEDRQENTERKPASFNLPRENFQEYTQIEIKSREKSPKSVLREAKEKLKTNIQTAKDQCQSPLEKSPSTVLKEAKQRLKKLEIEAEAVEKSYLDFRRKREALRSESNIPKNSDDVMKGNDTNRSSYKLEENAIESTSKTYKPRYEANLQTFAQEYCAKYDIGQTHFKNKNAVDFQVSPIPKVYSDLPKEKLDLLETPLTEFRKYYASDKRVFTKERSKSASPTRYTYFNTPNSQTLSRPLTPILKNNSGSPRTVQITLEHSSYEKPDGPDGTSLSKTLIIKSVKDNSASETERQENIIPRRSTAKSDNELSGLNIDQPEIRSLANSPVKKSDDLKVTSNAEISSSRSQTPISGENSDFKNNSVNDNLESNSGNFERSHNYVPDTRKEIIRKAKHDNVKELQILEQNIKKIYNLPEHTNLNEKSDDKGEENTEQRRIIDIKEAANIQPEIMTEKNEDNNNLLRIEVENVSDSQGKSSRVQKSRDILFTVESSIDGNVTASEIESDRELSPKMTIIVSPKHDLNENADGKAEKLSEQDVLSHIYQSPVHNVSSVQKRLDLAQAIEDKAIELEQNEDPDYPDDFSADVDNYNSRSEHHQRSYSPISLAKTSEDENFWDS